MAVKIGSGDDNPATDSCCVADKVVCGISASLFGMDFLLGSVMLAAAVLSFLMQQS